MSMKSNQFSPEVRESSHNLISAYFSTTSTAKAIRVQRDFHTVSGGTLATWGLGVLLLALSKFASKQLFVLPILLLPLALWALIVSVCSPLPAKREDSSQIALLSAAGVLLSEPIVLTSSTFYYVLSAVLAFTTIANFRRALSIAPLGIAIVFVALLAPSGASVEAVTLFAFVALLGLAHFGRYERQVAKTSWAMLSALYILCKYGGSGWLPFLLAALYILVVYYLRITRASYGKLETERRIFLDEVVVLSALALALASTTELTVSERYATLSLLFLVIFLIHYLLSTLAWSALEICSETASFKRTIVKLLTWEQPIRVRTTLAAAGLSAILAIDAMTTFGEDRAIHRGAQVFGICLIALVLYWAGGRGESTVRRDLAKLSLAYAVLTAYFGLSFGRLQLSPLPGALILIFAQYFSIAALVVTSSRDLNLPVQGAWQGIFPGRSLAQIRRARSKIFEVLSQAPLVGWMFHLGDKAASNLQEAFGRARSWTIANYMICIAVLFGLLASVQITKDILLNRLPSLEIALLGPSAEQSEQLFQESISALLASVLYCIVIHVVGTRARMQFLRYLASLHAAFVLAILWFQSLEGKNPTSGWFFPLGYVCFSAAARLVTLQKDGESPARC